MTNLFQITVRALSPAAMLLLAACATLPNAGPSAGSIAEQAGPAVAPHYELVDIDPAIISILSHSGRSSFQAHFGDYRPSVEPRIGVGDRVSIAIWEASAGGLFSNATYSDKAPPGSKNTTLPDQVVGRDGAITVPYAGRVRIAGFTTRSAEKLIDQALVGKSIQPQTIVNVTHSASNSVTIGGEVSKGARVPLNVNGDRVMDVIAMAGGIRAPVDETYVELSRGKTMVRVPLSRVASNPRENIYVRANDVLTLVRDPHTFIAYGATGRNAEIPFGADGITLAQALAKAGGLLDFRSDPAGVFVFRYEPASIARALSPNNPLIEPGHLTPVVYRLNLQNANNLFLAQRFMIQNRDLIYVSNAPLTELQKALGIFNSVMAPVTTGASVCMVAGC
ncbi:MAG: polysaccharide biosynthesis/export family protein [Methylovirgula sp.]